MPDSLALPVWPFGAAVLLRMFVPWFRSPTGSGGHACHPSGSTATHVPRLGSKTSQRATLIASACSEDFVKLKEHHPGSLHRSQHLVSYPQCPDLLDSQLPWLCSSSSWRFGAWLHAVSFHMDHQHQFSGTGMPQTSDYDWLALQASSGSPILAFYSTLVLWSWIWNWCWICSCSRLSVLPLASPC